ncbi:hypothetical protein F4678DRAFT_440355 [Xylaria arbuscula]|nr:hypothetical protein F4678DRAFT_440355 [Xylaria arbuscula]
MLPQYYAARQLRTIVMSAAGFVLSMLRTTLLDPSARTYTNSAHSELERPTWNSPRRVHARGEGGTEICTQTSLS